MWDDCGAWRRWRRLSIRYIALWHSLALAIYKSKAHKEFTSDAVMVKAQSTRTIRCQFAEIISILPITSSRDGCRSFFFLHFNESRWLRGSAVEMTSKETATFGFLWFFWSPTRSLAGSPHTNNYSIQMISARKCCRIRCVLAYGLVTSANPVRHEIMPWGVDSVAFIFIHLHKHKCTHALRTCRYA